ncbi:hypothetical protein E4T56_gene13098 [Termitomyces sp. T112]|nr:hypothetical protein E4T56_gene13098 [Termitomyces sp. T112]
MVDTLVKVPFQSFLAFGTFKSDEVILEEYGSKFTEKEFKKAIKKKVSYKDDGIYEEDIPQALLSGDEFMTVVDGEM